MPKLKFTWDEFIDLAYESIRNKYPQAHWTDNIQPTFMKDHRDGEYEPVELPDSVYVDLEDLHATIHAN